MKRRWGTFDWFWVVCLGITTLGIASPVSAQVEAARDPVTVERQLAEALEFEQAGQWDRALQLYCRLLAADRQLVGVRDRLFHCLRHTMQVRRHRDPSFRERVLSLPVNKALDLYAEVLHKLQVHYVERDRSSPSRLLRTGFDEFTSALNDPTFRQQYLSQTEDLTIRRFIDQLKDAWESRTVRDVREARTIVREVTLAAQRELRIDNPVVVVMEFMAGACNALDEFTTYLTPGQLIAESSRPLLELQAFGMTVGIRGEHLIVTDVRPDSLAEANLVRKDDRIVRVNKVIVAKPTPELLVEWFRSQPGGIELELQSPGAMSGYTMRIPGTLPTVIGTTILKEGVGYLHLVGFRDSTLQELDEAILSLKGRGMKSLILDLRGNPGGLFLIGVQAAERFLGEGVIVTTQGQLDEFNKTYSAGTGTAAHQFPLIVLVDGETASAAEIFAAAMKDNQRAILVGTVTYGKGTIQIVRSIEVGAMRSESGRPVPTTGAIRITVGRFYAPSGVPLSQTGVTPNFIESSRDRQLEIALDHASRHLMQMQMGMGMRP